MRCQRKRDVINEEVIREFLNKRNVFAGVVASNNPKKLGYKIFKAIRFCDEHDIDVVHGVCVMIKRKGMI